jgi:hypothetical protein
VDTSGERKLIKTHHRFPRPPALGRCILISFEGPQLNNLAASLPLPRSESVLEKPVYGNGLSTAVDRTGLPLTAALGYATGVAAALRERHLEMPPHTNGGPDRAPAGPLGPVLHRSEHFSRQAEQHSDIAAFGAMLYELVTGSRPPQDVSRVVLPRIPGVGAEGVRTAVTRLALRCVAGEPQDMNRILMELRLYGVIARQSGWRAGDSMKVPAGHRSGPPRYGNPLSAVSERGRLEPDTPPAGVDSRTRPQSHPTIPPPEMIDPARGGPWFPVSADEIELPYCGGKCPACGGSFIHLSRPRERFEYLLISIGVRLKRCHRCFYRYVVILGVVFTRRTH